MVRGSNYLAQFCKKTRTRKGESCKPSRHKALECAFFQHKAAGKAVNVLKINMFTAFFISQLKSKTCGWGALLPSLAFSPDPCYNPSSYPPFFPGAFSQSPHLKHSGQVPIRLCVFPPPQGTGTARKFLNLGTRNRIGNRAKT